MFHAVVFLAGPSRFSTEEIAYEWKVWSLLDDSSASAIPVQFVYIADGGLESFLPWYDSLTNEQQMEIKDVVWCGDGDSLGKHGSELRASTAARFVGRWREHVYSGEKDFSDCAAITSLLEYDLRHVGEDCSCAWIQVKGAWGGRLDHELANLFEFCASLQRMPCVGAYLLGPDHVLTTVSVRGSMNKGDTFSIVPPQSASTLKVKISGARYSGDLVLQQPSHGLSNVALEPSVEIIPENHTAPVLILRPGSLQVKKDSHL